MNLADHIKQALAAGREVPGAPAMKPRLVQSWPLRPRPRLESDPPSLWQAVAFAVTIGVIVTVFSFMILGG